MNSKVAVVASLLALGGTILGFSVKHSEPAEKLRTIESWETSVFQLHVKEIVDTALKQSQMVTKQDLATEHELVEKDIQPLARGQERMQKDLDRLLTLQIEEMKKRN